VPGTTVVVSFVSRAVSLNVIVSPSTWCLRYKMRRSVESFHRTIIEVGHHSYDFLNQLRVLTGPEARRGGVGKGVHGYPLEFLLL